MNIRRALLATTTVLVLGACGNQADTEHAEPTTTSTSSTSTTIRYGTYYDYDHDGPEPPIVTSTTTTTVYLPPASFPPAETPSRGTVAYVPSPTGPDPLEEAWEHLEQQELERRLDALERELGRQQYEQRREERQVYP